MFYEASVLDKHINPLIQCGYQSIYIDLVHSKQIKSKCLSVLPSSRQLSLYTSTTRWRCWSMCGVVSDSQLSTVVFVSHTGVVHCPLFIPPSSMCRVSVDLSRLFLVKRLGFHWNTQIWSPWWLQPGWCESGGHLCSRLNADAVSKDGYSLTGPPAITHKRMGVGVVVGGIKPLCDTTGNKGLDWTGITIMSSTPSFQPFSLFDF